MGTFVGHIVPGLTLALLGLWHTFNTIKAYNLKGKTKFHSRFWYPFNIPFYSFKYLELILIFSFSIFAIVMQVLDFPLLKISLKLDNLEHATMFVHLVIYAGFTLAVELMHSPECLMGLTGILATTVFSQELLLLHFHSADHTGLEGHCHWLLQLIVVVSLTSCIAMTSFSSSFVPAIVLSISVMFQGFWFINMGLMLWVPQFVPKECTTRLLEGGLKVMVSAVTCETEEAGMRAKALATLEFSWLLAGIVILTSFMSLMLSGKCVERNRPSEYEQLHSSRSLDLGRIAMTTHEFLQVQS
ncbi:hypothetical protein GIB67_010421 [Kingdonia uniflora]|uniref:Uncharacterized protein n=1 Tax=Kingdonia uniflora TaxID=39325 RepID=A0A7J7MAE6_9MAGN|nr:hypothetical protein GIB67_010421 [Kingdonia uniflora]